MPLKWSISQAVSQLNSVCVHFLLDSKIFLLSGSLRKKKMSKLFLEIVAKQQ